MKTILSIALVALTATAAQAGALYDGLSAANKAKIDRGEQAEITVSVPGSQWPRITALERVEATPEQLAGIMFDYALHKDFFEDVTTSTPRNPGARVTEVDYVMTLPPMLGFTLDPEVYVITDTLSTFGPAGYEISWVLKKPTTAKEMTESTGSAKFEPLGTGTLVSYTSFIRPVRTSAIVLRGTAIERVHGAVTALKVQVAKERRSQQDKLNDQVAALARALGR